VADRVRQAIESTVVVAAPGQRISVTVSVGGAFAPQWVRSSSPLWMERADQQLYRAKAAGRNCICLESSPPTPSTATPREGAPDAQLGPLSDYMPDPLDSRS
jgi:hypothetical protein